jgi:large subunit ribosomal protein L18
MHIYAQIIDDAAGVTICSASTQEKDFTSYGGNKAAAREIGKILAGRAKAKGVSEVVFDRGGYLYHGRVKELADGAREAGLQF